SAPHRSTLFPYTTLFRSRHIAGGMVWWNSSLGELQGQVIGIMKAMEDAVEGKMTVTVKQITAQDDRVAIEAESYARLKSGAIYRSEEHTSELQSRENLVC